MKKNISLYIILVFLIMPIHASGNNEIIVHSIEEMDVGRNLIDLNIYPEDFYEQTENTIIVGNFLLPYIRISSEDIIYDVCYDWNYIIRNISVDFDSIENFSTPEGIYINMSYKEFKKKIGHKKLDKSTQFGYFIQLPSGWWISFWIGDTGIDHYPKNDDKVSAIFKR